jgi:D-amino peptidase
MRNLLIGVLMMVITAAGAQGQQGLKIFISADMEGVAGVVTGEQLGPTGFEYQRARELMTEEVLAAIYAATTAGATEIVVADSHGNMQNILLERLPRHVRLIRGTPRPLMMMQGLDESFDAVIFIGYHAGTTSPAGVRAHTVSSARLADIRLNGISMPEAGINAAIAGHFGVPVVMISGDDVAVAEAQKIIGAIEGAVVKEAIGFHAANTLTPEAARDLIRDRVTSGINRRGSIRPMRIDGPIELELRFKNYRPAEVLAFLPSVERTGSHTVRFIARDPLEVARIIGFVVHYEPGLEP